MYNVAYSTVYTVYTKYSKNYVYTKRKKLLFISLKYETLSNQISVELLFLVIVSSCHSDLTFPLYLFYVPLAQTGLEIEIKKTKGTREEREKEQGKRQLNFCNRSILNMQETVSAFSFKI